MSDLRTHNPGLAPFAAAALLACAPAVAQNMPAAPIPGPFQVMPMAPEQPAAPQAPIAMTFPNAATPVPYWMVPNGDAPAVQQGQDAPAPVYLGPQQQQRWQLRFVPGWGWVPEQPGQAAAGGATTFQGQAAAGGSFGGYAAPRGQWSGYGPYAPGYGWAPNQGWGQR